MQWLRKTSSLGRAFFGPIRVRDRRLQQLRNFEVSSAKRIPQTCTGSHRLDVPESPLKSVELKNGMRLICEHKDSCVTTVGCFLPAGSIHERPEERGASLLMEHLIFRRTRCRSREAIADVLERTGGKLGALAMRDMFLFYGSIPSCDVESIMELLADAVLNGMICDEDITAARFMILRELSEIETDKERVVMDYLPMTAYQDTDLGRSVYPDTCTLEFGKINNICLNQPNPAVAPATAFMRSIRVQTVEGFRKRLFKPSSMTMVCTGGTSFSDFQGLASEYFVGTRQDPCASEEDRTVENLSGTPHYRFTGSDIRLRDDDESLGYVAVAVEGPGHANCQDHCTLTVAKEIVGSWDVTHGGDRHNAPHLAHCAFNTDMCHMYRSFNIAWARTSLWGCYFVCEKMQLWDMMWMVQNEWMRLCSTITSKEVARAVNQAKTRELVRVNDSVDRFFDITTCLHRRGCYESFNQRLARYDNVTVESLRDVANKYIYDQCPAVAAVGRIENLSDYNCIRSYMYRIRH